MIRQLIAFLAFAPLCFSSISIWAANVPLKIEKKYSQHGTLFIPKDGADSHPGIIVLHGSEGGGRNYHTLEAQRLAQHGYVTLAVCYFQCHQSTQDIVDPQAEFIDIPIDKPYAAFRWLRSSKLTLGHKTAVMGTSKGAELSFLMSFLAAKEGLPTPDAVAAHAVTDAAEVGFNWNWQSQKCWSWGEDGAPKWNPVCGAPVPTSTESFGSNNQKSISRERTDGNIPGCFATPKKPQDSYTYHSWTWKGSHEEIRTHHRFQTHGFSAPSFITHGSADKLWCVSKARGLRKILDASSVSVEMHLFEGEGHVLSADAESKRWSLLLNFFDRNLH